MICPDYAYVFLLRFMFGILQPHHGGGTRHPHLISFPKLPRRPLHLSEISTQPEAIGMIVRDWLFVSFSSLMFPHVSAKSSGGLAVLAELADN